MLHRHNWKLFHISSASTSIAAVLTTDVDTTPSSFKHRDRNPSLNVLSRHHTTFPNIDLLPFMTSSIVLAGAPETSKLDFNEKSLLPEVAAPHRIDVLPSHTLLPARNSAFQTKWRQLPESLRMRPIELPKLDVDPKPRSQEVEDTSAAEFFTPSEYVSQQSLINSDVPADESLVSEASTESSEPLSEFYDHSFAIHEAVPSSQLSEISELPPDTPTYESNEEMFPDTPASTGIIRSPSQRRLSQFPRPKHLSDLEDIPNANYLRSIEPQTMTVNLIVAVLSIGQPKTVITGAKYKQRETELVEMLVGDETKTDFCITFWLPREMRVNWKDGAKATPEGSRSQLRRSLKITRPRDVILIQNVALSSFKGKVHGQSLRRDVTKIDLLFRRKIDETDFGGIYSVQTLRNATDSDKQILKVKRVKDWMLNFVGDAAAERRSSERSRSSGRGRRRILPPDTQ